MEAEGRDNAYKHCMRNLTVALGTYTIDGCTKYVAANDASQLEASKLLCTTCGCHRSFHWKETLGPNPLSTMPMPPQPMTQVAATNCSEVKRRKRERTKFTLEQKERMRSLADSLGWRLSNYERDEELERVLEETGVSRKVFKVWMHNHKNEATKVQAVPVPTDTEKGDGVTGDANAAIVPFVPAEAMDG